MEPLSGYFNCCFQNVLSVLIIWLFQDYHVFLIYSKPNEKTLVLDLDTSLEFPCDFQKYYKSAIRDDGDFKPEYRRFRKFFYSKF